MMRWKITGNGLSGAGEKRPTPGDIGRWGILGVSVLATYIHVLGIHMYVVIYKVHTLESHHIFYVAIGTLGIHFRLLAGYSYTN